MDRRAIRYPLDMPPIEPTPTFRGNALIVDYAAGIVDAHAIHQAILEICRRADEARLGEAAVIAMIEQGAQRHGAVARLAGRAPRVLAFTVAKV